LLFVELVESKSTVLLAFCENGVVKLYNLLSLQPHHEYTNPGGYIYGVSLNPITKEILVASEDGFIRVLIIDEEYGLKIRFASSVRTFEDRWEGILKCNFELIFFFFFFWRAIDVCWDEENIEDFYGSYESGLIRKFNKAKQVIATMSVKENNEKTVAWRIRSLKNA